MIIHCGPGNVVETNLEVIVIPVNVKGVMGCGLALWAKMEYPFIFASYRKLCEEKHYGIGDLVLYKVGVARWILLFPTKDDWEDPSKLEYIEAGLLKFKEMVKHGIIKSASFPALGCGYGQLDFETQVRPLLYEHLAALPIPIEIVTRKQKKKTS